MFFELDLCITVFCKMDIFITWKALMIFLFNDKYGPKRRSFVWDIVPQLRETWQRECYRKKLQHKKGIMQQEIVIGVLKWKFYPKYVVLNGTQPWKIENINKTNEMMESKYKSASKYKSCIERALKSKTQKKGHHKQSPFVRTLTDT